MNHAYDWVIVGAGWYGAVFARERTDRGDRCLVIDRRPHIAGNAWTRCVDDIPVHHYGAHIFHTNSQDVWQWVQRFGTWRPYYHRVRARYQDRVYSLPFNLATFQEFWGVNTAEQAQAQWLSQRLVLSGPAQNLEEQALSMVGPDIYHALILGYTQKQWGRHPRDLPASIIQRIPLRWNWDDGYFSDRYQALPEGGYTAVFERMLSGIDVRLGQDYFQDRQYWDSQAPRLVFTGAIDEFFGYEYGPLEYRSLEFQHETLDQSDYQGISVMNYTDAAVPWTRIIEHRHFVRSTSDRTVITREYPRTAGDPYYPINDLRNQQRLRQYQDLAATRPQVVFGGRLAEYRYYDQHQVIASALHTSRKIA